MANEFDQFDEPNAFDQFDEENEEKDIPLGDANLARADVLISLARSIGAEIAAGLTGFVAAPLVGVDRAAEGMENVRGKIGAPPATQMGRSALEGIGKVGELIIKGARMPIAGIAGLFQLPAGIHKSAQTIERVVEEGIGETAGGAVLEATGSPGLAAAVKTFPTGLATLFGFKAPKAVPKKTPDAPKAEPVTDIEFQTTIEPRKPADIAKDLRKGDVGTVADDVIPDREVIDAAKRLGVDLNPEHYSLNVQFQEVARALKARAGTRLEARERTALNKLSERADTLIEDLGGSTDKASVSSSISGEIRSTITAMEGAARTLYSKVDEAIPKATRVEPNAVRDYLNKTLEELGGDKSLLTTSERQLLNLTRHKVKNSEGIIVEEAINPTYSALDRVRRNVGDGYRRQGPFKDESTGNLDQVYRVLSQDQQAVAEAFGVGDLYTKARAVVQKRKTIEEQAVSLFGRAMNESMVPRIRSAAQSLSKGDISSFNKLIEALPEGRRAEVVATLLGDIFASGSRTGTGLSGGFVRAYNALNRNADAKALLFKHLPDGQQRFDDIGKVYSAIYKANQKPLSNPSGSAAPIIAALENGGVLSKIYSVGSKVAVAEGVSTVVGLPGAGTAGVIGTILAKGRVPATQAADALLTSSEFNKAIGKAINNNVSGANEIAKSTVFKEWVGTLDRQQQIRLANVGFIGWLVSEDQNQEEPE